jgi:uncharacterized membrane protein
MPLVEAVGALWIMNCVISVVLSVFVGFETAVLWIAITWSGMAVLAAGTAIVESFVDLTPSKRVIVKEMICGFGIILLALLGILAFPVFLIALKIAERIHDIRQRTSHCS